MSRRLRLALLAAAVLAVLAAAGRVEGDRAARAQSEGFAKLLALAGPRWATTADSYRLTPTFDCLLYDRDRDPYAIELCFDPQGRIVEAIDRRHLFSPVFWSLRFDPGSSTVRVNPARMLAAFKRLDPALEGATSIPLGTPDTGPSNPVHKR